MDSILPNDPYEVNYELRDYVSILSYIQAKGGECLVDDIFREAGADKLRVYPILIKMELGKELEVTEKSQFGSPVRIKLNPDCETFGKCIQEPIC